MTPRALLMLLTLLPSWAWAQISVCQALDSRSQLDGTLVQIKGYLNGSSFHGFDLWQYESNQDPCPGWRSSFLTSPSIITLAWDVNGVSLSATEKKAIENTLRRASEMQGKTESTVMKVIALGRLEAKPFSLIFRSSTGAFKGNGFGDRGAYAARLVLKELKEIP